jgi:pyrimidine and pyridine-specific 5'-nucleotidase
MEGLVYCDYEEPNFSCKPERPFYETVSRRARFRLWVVCSSSPLNSKALKQANVKDPSKCFFVDDSRRNVEAALDAGWGRCVHFAEPIFSEESGSMLSETLKAIDFGDHSGKRSGSMEVITDLEQLRTVWSDIFKPSP